MNAEVPVIRRILPWLQTKRGLVGASGIQA